MSREAGRADPADLDGVLAAARSATLSEEVGRAFEAVAAAVAREPWDRADPRPAIVVAGLRNPCAQIDTFQRGLLKQVLGKDEDGTVVRKGGVMTVVLRGGAIRPGDHVVVELPPPPYGPLEKV